MKFFILNKAEVVKRMKIYTKGGKNTLIRRDIFKVNNGNVFVTKCKFYCMKTVY